MNVCPFRSCLLPSALSLSLVETTQNDFVPFMICWHIFSVEVTHNRVYPFYSLFWQCVSCWNNTWWGQCFSLPSVETTHNEVYSFVICLLQPGVIQSNKRWALSFYRHQHSVQTAQNLFLSFFCLSVLISLFVLICFYERCINGNSAQ